MLYRLTKRMTIDEFKEFMDETFGPRRFKNHHFNAAKFHMKLEDFGGWIGFLEGEESVELSIVIKRMHGYAYDKIAYLETFGFEIEEEKESN